MNKTNRFRIEYDKYINSKKLVKVASQPFEKMSLPETLYKYRCWNNELHRSVLTDRIVFMAAPSTFEDPLDCKNPIRWDLLRKKDIYFKYFSTIKEERPDWPKRLMKSWAKGWYKKSPLRNKEFVKAHQAQTLKDFDIRFGVLSLTANPNNNQMWESYSDNYNGFCVGFYPPILFKFLGGGCPVFYEDELPIIYPTPRHSFEEQHILQVFYKLKKWSFEEEYRTHKFSPVPFTLEKRKIKVPPEAYKEIIIGKNMSYTSQQELFRLLPKELKNIKIIYQNR